MLRLIGFVQSSFRTNFDEVVKSPEKAVFAIRQSIISIVYRAVIQRFRLFKRPSILLPALSRHLAVLLLTGQSSITLMDAQIGRR